MAAKVACSAKRSAPLRTSTSRKWRERSKRKLNKRQKERTPRKKLQTRNLKETSPDDA